MSETTLYSAIYYPISSFSCGFAYRQNPGILLPSTRLQKYCFAAAVILATMVVLVGCCCVAYLHRNMGYVDYLCGRGPTFGEAFEIFSHALAVFGFTAAFIICLFSCFVLLAKQKSQRSTLSESTRMRRWDLNSRGTIDAITQRGKGQPTRRLNNSAIPKHFSTKEADAFQANIDIAAPKSEEC
ncbi:hypothetical protein RB195_017232 [Necator americanus]|uniref:Uncharacterized protein n=1 Tax=Necator americanus TaxID=51031 RepID=A0ABR1C7F6_NECAM